MPNEAQHGRLLSGFWTEREATPISATLLTQYQERLQAIPQLGARQGKDEVGSLDQIGITQVKKGLSLFYLTLETGKPQENFGLKM